MTEEKLTAEQAEAMLKQLAKHFNEPVMPMSRYCAALETWGRCIAERAQRLRQELLPHYSEYRHPDHEAERKEYDHAKMRNILSELVPVGVSFLPTEFAASVVATVRRDKTSRERKLEELLGYEEAAWQVDRAGLAIHKSNLLARLLYAGEKLRTQMCPIHKGVWSGIEWGDNPCPHKCQLTGWVQEEADQGKPLPGVQAVRMVPTGNAPGEVTMIRDVDGSVLGKATLLGPERPPKDPATCRGCDEPGRALDEYGLCADCSE